MPLIPNSNNNSSNNQSTAPSKQELQFNKSFPIYTFADLILSEKTIDELKTVVSAQKNWKKVFIDSEKDILKLVNTIIANTKGEGAQSGEDFWVKAERLYYSALIGYIWYEAEEDEKNLNTLIEMINASEAREEDETFKNPVDILFDELEAREPDHFAVRQYKKYKLAAGKTAKSILISCGARLAPFDIKELRELTEYDELVVQVLSRSHFIECSFG